MTKTEQPAVDAKTGEVTPQAFNHEHDEAAWLFFTEYWMEGQKYNLTVRQGSTPDEVENMLNTLHHLHHAAKAVGMQVGYADAQPAQPASATPPPPPPEQTQTAQLAPVRGGPPAEGHNGYTPNYFAGHALADNQFGIAKLQIEGTKDKPVVSMFSHNPALQYRVIGAPASMVISILVSSYPNDFDEAALSPLTDVGRELPVQWIVNWERSPKNERWKDIKTIRIPKLGDPIAPEMWSS